MTSLLNTQNRLYNKVSLLQYRLSSDAYSAYFGSSSPYFTYSEVVSPTVDDLKTLLSAIDAIDVTTLSDNDKFAVHEFRAVLKTEIATQDGYIENADIGSGVIHGSIGSSTNNIADQTISGEAAPNTGDIASGNIAHRTITGEAAPNTGGIASGNIAFQTVTGFAKPNTGDIAIGNIALRTITGLVMPNTGEEIADFNNIALHTIAGEAAPNTGDIASGNIALDTVTGGISSGQGNIASGTIHTYNIASNADIAGTQLSPSANIVGSQLSAGAAIAGTQLANAAVTNAKQGFATWDGASCTWATTTCTLGGAITGCGNAGSIGTTTEYYSVSAASSPVAGTHVDFADFLAISGQCAAHCTAQSGLALCLNTFFDFV